MNKKHEIEIKEFKCPFCEHKEVIKINEKVEKNGQVFGAGIDYWECPKCGEENDIGLECFEDDFKIFKNYTKVNDWNGLMDFCKNNKFDDFMLFSLAKYYLQKQEFEKSLNIAKILVEINPKRYLLTRVIKKSKKGLEFIEKIMGGNDGKRNRKN